MTYIPPRENTLAAATRAQRVARARGIARRVVITIAALPIIHGDYPRESLQMGDWSGALDEEKCALWLLERDMRYLMIEELALEWLRQARLTDHGMWPEIIPYPEGELARITGVTV